MVKDSRSPRPLHPRSGMSPVERRRRFDSARGTKRLRKGRSATPKDVNPMFEKYNTWREEQLKKGEERLERLNARSAELGTAIDEARAQRREKDPSPNEQSARAHRPRRGKFKGEDGVLAFSGGELRYSGRGRRSVPLSEVREVRVEDGSEFRRRATLGRTGGGALVGGLFFGPVGLLAGMGLGAVAKKEDGGEKFLTVEAESAAFAVEVPRKQVAEAQSFAVELRNAARA